MDNPRTVDCPARRILILGTSEHARVVADAIERGGGTVVGRIDTGSESVSNAVDALSPDALVIAIGDNWVRRQVALEAARQCPSTPFASVVHPDAVLSRNVFVGPGAVVMAGAVVQTGGRIGAHAIVNTRASVDHDCVVAEFSSIGPGATLGGGVRIGEGAIVAIGAVVRDHITVGEHALVGAGAAAVASVPPYAVVIGVPARILRRRAAGDPYLSGGVHESLG